ncbi:hypothetical protein HHUSO_G14819 [Huso huso]|uniref:Uncharacterized protein n=1 Tax=Huso huso TaxID=61971 RepID=A0ABR0ZEV6_HUSHU
MSPYPRAHNTSHHVHRPLQGINHSNKQHITSCAERRAQTGSPAHNGEESTATHTHGRLHTIFLWEGVSDITVCPCQHH